jgi:DNA replication protein DnaD
VESKIEQSGIKELEYQTNESLDNLFKNFERNFGLNVMKLKIEKKDYLTI